MIKLERVISNAKSFLVIQRFDVHFLAWIYLLQSSFRGR